MAELSAILAFHAVEDGPGPLCVPPRVFERQVAALAESGTTVLTVAELTRHLRSGTLPEKAVALTFDDGYESVHRFALPILSHYGFKATVLPVTAQLGRTNAWDAALGRSSLRVLAPSQVVELASCGWEVGAHTHTHRSLAGAARDEVVAELAVANHVLEELLGIEVQSFAFPYGVFDAASRRIAADTYESCLGIGAGLVGARSSIDVLDRVDAWYVRRPWQMRSLLHRRGRAYLALRRAGRRVRSHRSRL